MSMPFYVSPEQMMKDRADFARKGIARGRSVVAIQYAALREDLGYAPEPSIAPRLTGGTVPVSATPGQRKRCDHIEQEAREFAHDQRTKHEGKKPNE